METFNYLRALSLSGGSTSFPFLAGAAISLDKQNDYQKFAGTSSGAVISFVLACKKNTAEAYRALETFSLELDYKLFMKENPASFKGAFCAIKRFLRGDNHFFDQNPLIDTMKSVVSREEFDLFKESGKDLYVCVISLETAEKRLVHINNYEYEEALQWVLASASIPIMTAPVYLEGHNWVDGGLRDHNPGYSFSKLLSNEYVVDSVFNRPKNLSDAYNFEYKKHKGFVGLFLNFMDTLGRVLQVYGIEVSKGDEKALKTSKKNGVIYYAPHRLITSTYEIVKGNLKKMFTQGKNVNK